MMAIFSLFMERLSLYFFQTEIRIACCPGFILSAKNVDKSSNYPGAASAYGMAKRDRAPERIEPLIAYTRLLVHQVTAYRKRLVVLEIIDILQGRAGSIYAADSKTPIDVEIHYANNLDTKIYQDLQFPSAKDFQEKHYVRC